MGTNFQKQKYKCPQTGALIPLLALISADCPTSILRNATWTLSNFCRGKPQVRSFKTLSNLQILKIRQNSRKFVGSMFDSFRLHINLYTKYTNSCFILYKRKKFRTPHPTPPPALLRKLSNFYKFVKFVQLYKQPQFELVAPALQTLAGLISSDDVEVLTDACWALSYLSDGTNDKIQAVRFFFPSPKIVQFLSNLTSPPKNVLHISSIFSLLYLIVRDMIYTCKRVRENKIHFSPPEV